MIKPRLILCGGVTLSTSDPRRDGRHVVELSSQGRDHNVNIQMEDVAKVFQQHLSPRLKDLLEIAAYVYTADCATKRNGMWEDEDATEPWPRDLHFVMPVRDLEFWQQAEISQILRKILRFVSNDEARFDFCQKTATDTEQSYLQFGKDQDWPLYGVDRVTMFSGGLDSLGGTVVRASKGKSLVLVSHRPVTVQDKRQKQLFAALKRTYSVPMIHVPVWLNKDGSKGKEHTQRTRSSLYVSLGAVVAHSVQARGVSFYENGVVSLNFPVADEVLRARSSRTTHPLILDYYTEFLQLVLETPFVVDNPFIFKTKADVVQLIAKGGGSHLIGQTCSCSHQGIFTSKTQLHCGTCSQCIDRRIAIMAAGLAEYDPETDYRTDVFTGARTDRYSRNMAINYARHGTELCRCSEEELAVRFNRDLSRAIRPFPHKREAAEKFIRMHQHHGDTVARVLREQVKHHADSLASCDLPETSLVSLVAAQQHKVSPWIPFANRIAELLQAGLPTMCATEPPRNEPRLQELCDGILVTHDHRLVREYPYMRWGSVMTKPDWSEECLGLWVEAKYVRTKRDIQPITEAISSDITKYGDNDRRVLFVVYDPKHLVLDEASFAEPIERRANMLVRFVR